MKKELFIVAIKDGQYFPISECKPGEGLNCGAFCPECREAVVSNVTDRNDLKRNFTNHFSHLSKKLCSGGHKETELHLFAKEVFRSSDFLYLPDPKGSSGNFKWHYDPRCTKFEKRLGKIRPDLILENTGGEQLIVEIAVTSFIKNNPKKLAKIEEAKVSVLEINLNSFCAKNLIGKLRDNIKRCLINEVSNKEWIRCRLKHDEHVAEEKDKENYSSLFIVFLLSCLTGWLLFKNKVKPRNRGKSKKFFSSKNNLS